jgi:hypothetical protein
MKRGAILVLLLAGCMKPDHVEFEPEQLSMTRRGEQVWVHAKYLDHQGRTYPKEQATWTSSDPKVATVDAKDKPGNVTAVGPGHCTITARTEGGIEAELPVSVLTVEKLQVSPLEVKLSEDSDKQPMQVVALGPDNRPLKGRQPHMKCLDEKVCNSDGENVWPVGPGATTLEVNVEDQTVKIPVAVEKGKAHH